MSGIITFFDIPGEIIRLIVLWIRGEKTRDNFIEAIRPIFEYDIVEMIGGKIMDMAQYGLMHCHNVNAWYFFERSYGIKTQNHIEFFLNLGLDVQVLSSYIFIRNLLKTNSVGALKYLRQNHGLDIKSVIESNFRRMMKMVIKHNAINSVKLLMKIYPHNKILKEDVLLYAIKHCQNLRVLRLIFPHAQGHALRVYLIKAFKKNNVVALRFLIEKNCVILRIMDKKIRYQHFSSFVNTDDMFIDCKMKILNFLFNEKKVKITNPDYQRQIIDWYFINGLWKKFFFMLDIFGINFDEYRCSRPITRPNIFLQNCDLRMLNYIKRVPIDHGDLSDLNFHNDTLAKNMSVEKMQFLLNVCPKSINNRLFFVAFLGNRAKVAEYQVFSQHVRNKLIENFEDFIWGLIESKHYDIARKMMSDEDYQIKLFAWNRRVQFIYYGDKEMVDEYLGLFEISKDNMYDVITSNNAYSVEKYLQKMGIDDDVKNFHKLNKNNKSPEMTALFMEYVLPVVPVVPVNSSDT